MAYNSTAWVTSGSTSTIFTTSMVGYKTFGCYDLSISQTNHVPICCTPQGLAYSSAGWSPDGNFDFGTGENPVLFIDVSETTHTYHIPPCLWYIHDNIIIISGKLITNCDQQSGSDTINHHLMSYDMDASTGDLTNGTVLADATSECNSTSQTSSDLNIISSSVAEGKVIICTVENADSTQDITTNVILKYQY